MKYEAIQALINQVWFDIRHIFDMDYVKDEEAKDILTYIEEKLESLTPEAAVRDDMLEYNLVSAMIIFEKFREYDAAEVNCFDSDCLDLIAAIREAGLEAAEAVLRKNSQDQIDHITEELMTETTEVQQ